eukprot:2605336-Lingulodinium_polyedra.AAC.1
MGGDREPGRAPCNQEEILCPERAPGPLCEVVDKRRAARNVHDGVVTDVPEERACRPAHTDASLDSSRQTN